MQIKGIWTNYHSENCPLPRESFVSTLTAGVNGHVCINVNKTETYLENGFMVTEGKTEGILVFYRKQWTFHSLREMGIQKAVNTEITCDGQGQIWMYVPPKSLYRFDDKNTDMYLAGKRGLPTDLGWVSSLATDTTGSVWMVCVPMGVYRFDGITWTKLLPAGNAISDLWVTYITVDLFGRVWFAAQDMQNTIFSVFEHNQSKEYARVSIGRGAGNVQSMAIDRDKTLWVGWGNFGDETNLGLWRAAEGGFRWEQYTVKNSPLLDNSIKSLTVDKKGRIWAGTTGGFTIFDGMNATSWEFINPGFLQDPPFQQQGGAPNGQSKIRISDYAVLDNEGRLWARSENGVSVFSEE